MSIVEPDFDEIGRIVDRYNDHSSEAWSRYHETARGQLKMSFWKNHFEWKFLVNRYPPCTVLDYGCGTGHSDVFLADAGYVVVEYEPNETNRNVSNYIASIQIDQIKRNLLFVNSVPDRNLKNFVDVVWISHVFEHVPRGEWDRFFEPIIMNRWKTLISVPLGRAHYVPSHVNIWETEQHLVDDLHSIGFDVLWSGVDSENKVIRAEVIYHE